MNPIEPNPVEPRESNFDIALSQSDFEFDFFGQMVRRGTTNIHILKEHAGILVQRGDRAAALEIERKLALLLPTDPIIRYNLACGLAVHGEIEESVVQLLESIRLGYRDFELMENDADLDSLRHHDVFIKLLDSQKNAGFV